MGPRLSLIGAHVRAESVIEYIRSILARLLLLHRTNQVALRPHNAHLPPRIEKKTRFPTGRPATRHIIQTRLRAIPAVVPERRHLSQYPPDVMRPFHADAKMMDEMTGLSSELNPVVVSMTKTPRTSDPVAEKAQDNAEKTTTAKLLIFGEERLLEWRLMPRAIALLHNIAGWKLSLVRILPLEGGVIGDLSGLIGKRQRSYTPVSSVLSLVRRSMRHSIVPTPSLIMVFTTCFRIALFCLQA